MNNTDSRAFIKLDRSEIADLIARFGEPEYIFRASKHLPAVVWLAILTPTLFTGLQGLIILLSLGVPPFLLSIHLDKQLQLKDYLQRKQTAGDMNTANNASTLMVTHLNIDQEAPRVLSGDPSTKTTRRSNPDIRTNIAAYNRSGDSQVQSNAEVVNDLADVDAIIDELLLDECSENAMGQLQATFNYTPREGLQEFTEGMALANVNILLEFCHSTALEIISLASVENLPYELPDGVSFESIWKGILASAEKQDVGAAQYLELKSNTFIDDLKSFLGDSAESGLVIVTDGGRGYRANAFAKDTRKTADQKPSSVGDAFEEQWINKALGKLQTTFDYSPLEGVQKNTEEMALANMKILLDFCRATAIELVTNVSTENLLNNTFDGINIDKIWKVILASSEKQDEEFTQCLVQASSIFLDELTKFLDDCSESGVVEINENANSYRVNFVGALEHDNRASESLASDQTTPIPEHQNQSNHCLANDKAVLIRLNKTYREGMTQDELYSASRGNWAISLKRAAMANYAYVLYKGSVVEVYSVSRWDETSEVAGNGFLRIKFTGIRAENRRHMIGLNLSYLFKQGESLPIKYLNC